MNSFNKPVRKTSAERKNFKIKFSKSQTNGRIISRFVEKPKTQALKI